MSSKTRYHYLIKRPSLLKKSRKTHQIVSTRNDLSLMNELVTR